MSTLDLAHRILSTHENNLPPTVFPDQRDVEAILAKLGTKPQVTIWPAPHSHPGKESSQNLPLLSVAVPYQDEHALLDSNLSQVLETSQAELYQPNTFVLPSQLPELAFVTESNLDPTLPVEFDTAGWSTLFEDVVAGFDDPLAHFTAGTTWTDLPASSAPESTVTR
jgi:hypothetical protein